MKKMVSFFAGLLLLVAGCTSQETQQPQEPDIEPVASAEELPERFDEPVTLSLIKHISSDITFKDGESIEDNVVTQWAKDSFNLEFDYLWTTSGPGDTFDTKLQLALSAGEKMPDVLPLRSNVAQDLIDSQLFLDVGEVFDKYASESWKEAMENDPKAWQPYMRDGKKYGIPILDYNGNGDSVMFIREDWRKKLGIDPPETLEDYEAMMEAFVTQDPDGNGEDDTYGVTFGLATDVNTWISDGSWVFGAYGTMPNAWLEGDDGTLVNGFTNPDVKKGLSTLHSWMESGYMHPEVGLWDAFKASELFSAGNAGIMAGPHYLPDWIFKDLAENVAGAEVKAYHMPTGPDGESGKGGGLTSHNGVVLINKDATEKQIQAFFVYQNYLFDHYADPAEGSEFEFGFFEGYDYLMEDGQPLYVATSEEDLVPAEKYTLTFDAARKPSVYINSLAALTDREAETPFEKRIAIRYPEGMRHAAKIVVDEMDIKMPSLFLGPPTDTMKSRGDALTTMWKETYNKIIYGELPVDAYDEFVEKWKSSGGDTITEEVNAWYESVK
ncbi:extracellular solute-binding protein [Aureibacillus halotolerans]|uniref:Carbohydrate ABC transporter substrate-binding protein (CUT1 family) n=1 Tax=Aureibacillus halotolerans TaxID=1508390 RepID=A0A4R6U3U6_9BACI|nr:extracellular solute-binding protein [Aureibacillus halotolerans]TDQ41090.1 carbohydrate ABC transporter substrate-binding protein (CUT1 family) [Aureibacillus halotolerans]